MVLSAFEDIFYRVRSHNLIRALTPNFITIPLSVSEALGTQNIAKLMLSLHLQQLGTSESGELRYVIGNTTRCPVTMVEDQVYSWVKHFYATQLKELF